MPTPKTPTPIPKLTLEAGTSCFYLLEADTRTYCLKSIGDEQETREFCETVIAWLNAHDKLVAALKGLLAIREEEPPLTSESKAHTDYCLREIAAEDKAREALKDL